VLCAVDLDYLVDRGNNIKKGCLVDTNVLFAFTFSDDSHHERAQEIINILIANKVPLLTNVNIRAEFLNLALQVIIPQGLSDMFKDIGKVLPKMIYRSLKSITQTINNGYKEERVIKLRDNKIKSLRRLLSNYFFEERSLWDIYCQDYLQDKLKSEWSFIDTELKLNFISLSKGLGAMHLKGDLLWSDVIKIMEKTAISSSDAMIINLLDKSHYDFISSFDEDIHFALRHLGLDNKLLIS